MKRAISLIVLALLLSGCATYKFHKGNKPYDKGYVVSRDDYTIVEYTLGRDKSVPPDLDLARQRFKRRHDRVEDSYKRMGYIENNFKKTLWNPIILSLKALGGLFKLPFVAVSDYKYEHNPEYRKKIIAREEEEDAREQARIDKLKEKLNTYIEKDLAQENTSPKGK